MDLKDEQIRETLRESLTWYLSVLDRARNLREAWLPSQGKASETFTDVSIEQDYQYRVVSIELCLRYSSDIAVSKIFTSLKMAK